MKATKKCRITCIILALTLMILTDVLSAAAQVNQEALFGDADGNGIISSNDALIILRYTVESQSSKFINEFDVDKDGSISSNDALTVLRSSVGLDDGYGVGQPTDETETADIPVAMGLRSYDG